jgi:hypothetical protein
MVSADQDPMQLQQMRANFEAGLPNRVRRASRVKLQNIIPAHWFAAAASECAGMYIAGYFYGAISIAQAYVEALSCFLADHHKVRVKSDPGERCRRLQREKLISIQTRDAALAILDCRNDFHHLNRQVEQEYRKLETRAEECINHLHTIESEVFAYSFGEEPGKVTLKKPEYWPSGGPGLTQVNLRQLW